ncbi:MAG: recombinase family protein [Flavobacteriaceae bacterium]|nr:recombinase family protein [Flavobacteriaceae bacterium]
MQNIFQKKCKKAVAYYRHSAEDKQENSIAIQREHTEKFAKENNIEIIHEEADEGKSGLSANRPAFNRLFSNWIKNPKAPEFHYILVYDVSRWGRFQDPNQAGHLEFQCTMYGKEVVYVSIGFIETKNKLFSNLMLPIHRYMAAAYSQQLSDKVFHGCVKVSEQGYSAGGTAVYGMVRQLLDVNKKPIRILKRGEHKQISNERVSFAPKNDETTQTVRDIFHLFVNEKFSIQDITKYLNKKGVLSANGKQWDRTKILRILVNETYIGTRIYNKTWGRLKQKSHKNPRKKWVVVPNAFEAIIEKELFDKAQERLYLLFPKEKRKGLNAIKKAKKSMKTIIYDWLLNKGFTEFESYKIIDRLPVIFAIKLKKDISLNCFIIPEDIRAFEKVLAVSVVPDKKELIDNFFLLPVECFTTTNFLILLEYSNLYKNSKVESEQIMKIIEKFLSTE